MKNLRINIRPIQNDFGKEITCQQFKRREGTGDTETTTKFAVWNWRNNEDIIVVIRTSEIHFRCS